MMKLTDAQAQILTLAAVHPDKLAVPPERLPIPARQAIAKSLLKYGLIAAVDGVDTNGVARWTVDGAAVLMAITEAGLHAIGQAPAAGDQTEADRDDEQEPAQRALDVGVEPISPGAVDQAIAAGVMPAQAVTQGSQTPTEGSSAEPARSSAPEPQDALTAAREGAARSRGQALRNAAHAVLVAWDDEAGNRSGLPDAIAGLRPLVRALARPVVREAAGVHTRRQGTRQEQVLALLRRPEGATIAQVVDATGWQHHTVRGFFAGLKKRQGIAVEVAERVRQVGPGKDGAKGSFTVYRIADVG